MSSESQHPSEEPTTDSGPGAFKPQLKADELLVPTDDFSPLDEADELDEAEELDPAEEAARQGQPPLAEGEEAPHREDHSTLPKATMPVELPEQPAHPADSIDPEDAPLEEGAIENPAQEEPQAQEALPQGADHQVAAGAAKERPSGLSGWLKSLSLAEKLCCLLLVGGLLVFASTIFVPALFDYEKEQGPLTSGDFPIKGEHVGVLSAQTHWREAILDGEDADTVRSGTLLIPEIDLSLNGSGNIRLLFRDSHNQLVGDPVAHQVQDSQQFSASSTAGLNEIGEFEAIRTGEAEWWSVEFHEAPAGDVDPSDFSLLFSMKISPVQQ